MKIAKIPHYMKKIYELGPRTALKVVSNRMTNSFFEQYSRYQADRKNASYTWPVLAQKYGYATFDDYWKVLKKRSFVSYGNLYQEQFSDTSDLYRQADAFSNNCFDILGSRDQCLMVMPWHSDFRLRYQNPDGDYLFDKNIFYKDFSIQVGLTDRLAKDIKVPWELSRCAHFYILGAAYQKSGNGLYAQSFVDYVKDWLDENPFLLGPNWVCPMDVGIRAFNWVHAFNFFKNSPDIDQGFWERFVCSLYDHMLYLENNWELYDKTSNHYLSDLLGYYALTWFFGDFKNIEKRALWCHKEFLAEFEKQIFDEGTDYEGSTSYHRLVTEIFYHFSLIAQEHGHTVSGLFQKKLEKMFTFIDWCTVGKNSFVKIGDDDSGKILQYGITQTLVDQMKESSALGNTEAFFKEFGLAVRKDDNWHVTLRHHAYKKEQPSGHFHNDAGSMTLAVRGIPVFVDPGSYVYTPSAIWRNQFRSAVIHNSFYIEDVEPVALSDRSLFTLDIPEERVGINPWKVTHTLYSTCASRELTFADYGTLIIEDKWADVPGHALVSCWNFTLAPGITALKEGSTWSLVHEEVTLATLQCEDLQFELLDAWYAPGYGSKVPSKRLSAKCDLTLQPVTMAIRLCD